MDATEIEGLLRYLTPQVLGAVVRRYGHFDLAEDATQEALVAAATQWPRDGLPDNPKGWLVAVAARRLTDLLRADQARRRREDTVAHWSVVGVGESRADVHRPADTDDTLVLAQTGPTGRRSPPSTGCCSSSTTTRSSLSTMPSP